MAEKTENNRTEEQRNGSEDKEYCRDYARGHCSRGTACPFQHKVGGSSDGEICRDFARGHCPRGLRCSHAHQKGGVDTGDLCRDFARGFCQRGINCPFVHQRDEQEQCRDFARGNCPRGNRCPFMHDSASRVGGVNPPLLSAPLAALPLNSALQLKRPQAPTRPVAPQHFQPEVCRDFSRGHCPRGPNCPFHHAVHDDFLYGGEEKSSENLDVCLDFLRDRCTRSRKCPFLHVFLVEGQENNTRILRAIHKMKSIKEDTVKTVQKLEEELASLKKETSVLRQENVQLREENQLLRKQRF